MYIFCAFVGLEDKLYKLHGMYFKIVRFCVHFTWIMKSIISSLFQ